jgi:hypothetical protein
MSRMRMLPLMVSAAPKRTLVRQYDDADGIFEKYNRCRQKDQCRPGPGGLQIHVAGLFIKSRIVPASSGFRVCEAKYSQHLVDGQPDALQPAGGRGVEDGERGVAAPCYAVHYIDDSIGGGAQPRLRAGARGAQSEITKSPPNGNSLFIG